MARVYGRKKTWTFCFSTAYHEHGLSENSHDTEQVKDPGSEGRIFLLQITFAFRNISEISVSVVLNERPLPIRGGCMEKELSEPGKERKVPDLPAWLLSMLPFQRKVMQIDGKDMHLILHGRGRPVLLIHGNPTWSFLWRKVVRLLDPERFLCVAPDLFGLGLSHKPSRVRDHSLAFHAGAVAGLVDRLGLEDVILVGQDWGGPIGCAAAARSPGRVTGLVMGNTALLRPRAPIQTTPFHRLSRMPVVSDILFRGFNFPVPILHRIQGDGASIRGDVAKAYAYPLRRLRDRAAPLALARMVPHREEHPSNPELEKVEQWVQAFQGPAALVWGNRDPILGRALKRMKAALPGATVTETDAGHFLQEEVPDKIADAIRAV